MPSLFYELWENLVARTEGPFHHRFYIEPALSVFFAFRAAFRDVKKHRPPYLWRLLATKKERIAVIQEGRRDVGDKFIFAILIDIAYQATMVYVFGKAENFLPLESVVVAFSLTVVPYLLIRGPINRLVRKWYLKKRQAHRNTPGENSHHII